VRMRRRDQGFATMFTAGLALVLVMAATVAVTVTAIVLAAHRARTSADLAALAAAAAEVSGLDPCDAARANARANRARVTMCRLQGDASSFVVSVTAAVDTGLRPPLPREVTSESHAGNARR
jgi:secretion/DNA translocation related TadE-like protein